jgi:ABC-type glutathione transport system ATPase component
MTALLQLEAVSVSIGSGALLDGDELRWSAGRSWGWWAKAGSGKSLTAMAAMGLLPLIGGRVSGRLGPL